MSVNLGEKCFNIVAEDEMSVSVVTVYLAGWTGVTLL